MDVTWFCWGLFCVDDVADVDVVGFVVVLVLILVVLDLVVLVIALVLVLIQVLVLVVLLRPGPIKSPSCMEYWCQWTEKSDLSCSCLSTRTSRTSIRSLLFSILKKV